MCTAVCYRPGKSYLGRNLDLEYRYKEAILIAPRNFPFELIHNDPLGHHYAIIGVGTEMNGYPLYYDAVNEYGLGIAALNFTESCVLNERVEGKLNLATFEIIPYILSSCKSVREATEVLKKVNLTQDRFSYKLPAAKLHFMLSDKLECAVAEPMERGMEIYENRAAVLTNEPPFPFHLKHLLAAEHGEKPKFTSCTAPRLKEELSEKKHHNGYDTITQNELDFAESLSSENRFLRAVAALRLSEKMARDGDAVNQFFHILSTVDHIDGAIFSNGKSKKTQYSSCACLEDAIYYCKTYSNSRIFSVKLKNEQTNSDSLISYPFIMREDIKEMNG